MKSDIRDIQPDVDDIPFQDKGGNEYSLPGSIPSEVHLEIIDRWDKLTPFMALIGHSKADRDKYLEELGCRKEEVIREADEAILDILAGMAKSRYPEMSAEWFKENLDGMERTGLSMEILMQASDFFARRLQREARMDERMARILNQAGK